MKTILLFMDMEFTSLSPDAQIISLGIVSDEINPKLTGNAIHDLCNPVTSKSFYAEFSDFDLNRCDDWVKDNVVSKLKMYGKKEDEIIENLDNENYQVLSITQGVKIHLKNWLSQFSDYQIQIQFVVDCGTYDWYWMVQLLAEWNRKQELAFTDVEHQLKPFHLRHEEELKLFYKSKGREIINVRDKMPKLNMDIKPDIISASIQDNSGYYIVTKTGLPKLPENISPVPFDLNDLIAIKKGITPKEAFDLDREELVKWINLNEFNHALCGSLEPLTKESEKHNSLSDARVIKGIYNNLK